MILSAEKFTVALRRPFRIAHGSSAARETILVHLRDGTWEAHGEGALPPYYPSRADSCLAWLGRVAEERRISDPPPAPAEAAAARVALEIAWQDLQAQQAGLPLWRRGASEGRRLPPCAATISIPESPGDLEDMLDEAVAQGTAFLKLKSGSGDLGWDEECVRLARQKCCGIPLGVDANGGWTPAEASAAIARLQGSGVEYVEEPVSGLAAWREFRDRLGPTPAPLLLADESLQSDDDLAPLSRVADGVNVKLLKAGGLDGARRWIAAARSLELRIMIGGMVETGIGRTATAQLAPLADWLDIDPPWSIPAGPMIGFAVEDGQLRLSERPGLGLLQI